MCGFSQCRFRERTFADSQQPFGLEPEESVDRAGYPPPFAGNAVASARPVERKAETISGWSTATEDSEETSTQRHSAAAD